MSTVNINTPLYKWTTWEGYEMILEPVMDTPEVKKLMKKHKISNNRAYNNMRWSVDAKAFEKTERYEDYEEALYELIHPDDQAKIVEDMLAEIYYDFMVDVIKLAKKSDEIYYMMIEKLGVTTESKAEVIRWMNKRIDLVSTALLDMTSVYDYVDIPDDEDIEDYD